MEPVVSRDVIEVAAEVIAHAGSLRTVRRAAEGI